MSKSLFIAPLIFTFAVVLCACSSTTSTLAKNTEAGLTRIEAESRSRVVSNVDYDLKFELSETVDLFKAHEEIAFDLSDIPKNLFLDFDGGKIISVETNGTSSKIEYDGVRLKLSSRELKIGRNAVLIDFERVHSHEGSGFHRFVDPTDKKVYLYTDLEPFKANQVFVNFDQPDLKARYRIRVSAPKTWEVISYALHDTVDTRGEERVWSFPWSPRFSTYIFSLHAGPYHVWKSKAGKIPLRLFARESLAKLVDGDEWLKITAQGLGFYPKYFGYEYPFGKYDQLLVPEFNAGAMENVAAVTFSEGHVFRSKPTREQRLGRADVILHEMAHMWFGDLVTMRWWDGLWLNESFATYLSSIAMTRATEFKTAWRSFASDTKGWAYWTDELVTTHPIQTPVADTNEAFASFDGITYGKGASALKQLHFLIGDEAFSQGLGLYFKNYAYKNTELRDFISSLEQSSGRSLTDWVQDWLMTAGLNKVAVKWNCAEGLLKSIEIDQAAPTDYPTLREHQTRVAFLKATPQGLIVSATENVNYSGANTEHVLEKPIACPAAVYPNFEDQDYVKVMLDARSLEVAQKQLSKIKDSWLRGMMTQALWTLVRDGAWDLPSFLKAAYTHLPLENDEQNLTAAMDSVSSAADYISRARSLADSPSLKAQNAALENFLGDRLRQSRGGSDTQALYFSNYVGVTESSSSLAILRGWLSGKGLPKGLSLGQDRRWRIVKHMNRIGTPDARDLVAAELKREDNDFARKAALASMALRPDAATKAELWKRAIEGKDSLDDQKQIMRNLFPSDQSSLQEKWADDFFHLLPKLAAERDEGFLDVFLSLTPATCNAHSVERLSDFIKKQGPKLSHAILKELRISLQEDERCVVILKNFASAAK
ncbi:MAG: aminopeptidase N [Bdellovibrionota bacterium]